MTLLEALVVVALTALVGAIEFPNLERAIGVLALREAASTLTADLRTVHADAMRTGQDVTFALTADGRAYGWTEGQARKMPDTVAVSMSPSAIRFFADGSATGGTLKLSAKGREVPISIDSATGSVSVGQ
ncbi:MAG TPA: GspH/FimT family pseudopilin [Rhizomicrobium sp.]|jgi:general secretion pathway protein H|nr:GspH/FimT family pseudopilin [Rhizomicrobium sp.]